MFRAALILLLAICSSSPLLAQNFFWSTSGFGEGAVNDDFSATAAQGDVFTVFLYYDAGGQQNITEGIDLDFSWSNPGIVEFTAAETFDFDIAIMGTDVGDRWGDFAGPADSVTANDVTGFLTVNVVSGSGIQVDQIPGNGVFEDTGYDPTADAFLVGSFTATKILQTNGIGTEIEIQNALVVDNGVNQSIPFKRFVLPPIPEPSSALLLMLFFATWMYRTGRTVVKS